MCALNTAELLSPGICWLSSWFSIREGAVCPEDLCFHGNIAKVTPFDSGRLCEDNSGTRIQFRGTCTCTCHVCVLTWPLGMVRVHVHMCMYSITNLGIFFVRTQFSSQHPWLMCVPTHRAVRHWRTINLVMRLALSVQTQLAKWTGFYKGTCMHS